MLKELWFPTPVWFDILDFDSDLVKQLCLEERIKNPEGRKRSNIGGWQSNSIRDYESFNFLFNLIEEKSLEILNEFDTFGYLELAETWININSGEDFNCEHYHPCSTLSGVLYVEVDQNSGNLVFNNPTPSIHYPPIKDEKLFHRTIKYKPSNNLIIIFPSWVPHEVQKSLATSKERISIAFNLNIKYKL